MAELDETARETRRAFRTIIRMIQMDDHFRETLAGFIKKDSENVYSWNFGIGETVDTRSSGLSLSTIWAWNYLLNTVKPAYEGAKFAAEIAWEFTHRKPTKAKWKRRQWSTQDYSEYVTRKIMRQRDASGADWWSMKFLGHIFLGLGPWPVGDDADDDATTAISAGTSPTSPSRSYGTGPWPKGNGAGTTG
ncbi:MAG: hypothetical protein ACFFFC_09770 [Candidatus Thorarchaeota archaeon]